jgi:hypothetical protein
VRRQMGAIGTVDQSFKASKSVDAQDLPWDDVK